MLAALAGGVGAAKFLRGLIRVVPPESVTVIVNTGDDDTFHGLHVSPDLDSVTYTLSGAENPDTGWGLADESFTTIDALQRYGVPTWFRLGDRDLATHLFRTQRLGEGATLTEVTAEIAAAWNLGVALLPMTDDPVGTRISVGRDDGTVHELHMQEWFVRERCQPPVLGVRFDGIEHARPAPGVVHALESADIIVVCPSNPVISIGPVVAVPGIREILTQRRERVVGVSPIIGGAPVKGPADRLMGPLGIDVSCVGIAKTYADFCSTLVIDQRDAARAGEISALGVRPVIADTLMTDARVAATLARHALDAVG